MATAAEPADGSEGPKPEKGRPEAARSEKPRLGAEVVGDKTSGPEAGARGHRRQKSKPRATESQSARAQAQRTTEPKPEGREPERTRPRRHFVAAERAVSGPGGGAGEPGAALARPRPSRPGPDSGPCRAHLCSSWQRRTLRPRTPADAPHVRRGDAVTIPRLFLHMTEPRLPTALAYAQP